jgi:glycosyltransferase involved in cell wall biosynthesis
MDLYPDVMVAHGMFGRGPAGRCVLAALRWLTRRELAQAGAVLTLGPDMAARCGQYVRPPGQVEWVPLWARDDLFCAAGEAVRELRRERGWQGKLVLLYSGNLGLGHCVGDLLAAAQSIEREAGSRDPRGRATEATGAGGADGVSAEAERGDHPVLFAFAGGGGRRPEVEAFVREHPGAPAELLPYAAATDLAVHLRSADVLLASLEPAWAGCMLPSKIQGIFAAGRPVVFVGSRDCAPARWVEDADAGWIVAPGDQAALAAAISAARDVEGRRRRGAAAQAYARRHFGREGNCLRIAEIVERAGHGSR